MRVDLKVPFAEKDAAKAAGARWDVNRKLWYVIDPPDLNRFARWLPEVAAFQATQQSPKAAAPKAAPLPTKASPLGATTVLPDCGCDVPPWEHCEHTVGR